MKNIWNIFGEWQDALSPVGRIPFFARSLCSFSRSVRGGLASVSNCCPTAPLDVPQNLETIFANDTSETHNGDDGVNASVLHGLLCVGLAVAGTLTTNTTRNLSKKNQKQQREGERKKIARPAEKRVLLILKRLVLMAYPASTGGRTCDSFAGDRGSLSLRAAINRFPSRFHYHVYRRTCNTLTSRLVM